MTDGDREEDTLRAVALRNSTAILLARQRTEEELREAKQALELRTGELSQALSLMQATLEATADGILVTDREGRIVGFNKKYLEMWGLPADALLEMPYQEMLRIVSSRCRYPDRLTGIGPELQAPAAREALEMLELTDGRVLEVSSHPQQLVGRIVGRVWSFRDVTIREQRLEAERSARMQMARVSQLKDEFLATLSHELRTPLTSILGWAKLLRQKGSQAVLERGLETIERNAAAQAKLIEDLLDMNRIISGKVRLNVRPTNVARAIDAAIDSVRPSAAGKDLSVCVDVDPGIEPVVGDPDRLQQVIWNLLSNAVKFTPMGGRIEVGLRRVDSYVQVSVRDSGIGVPKEFLPHVFDRFRQGDSSSTRRFGGLGLGLSIVKQLVELHGGTVEAASEGEGRGATFVISLPAAANRPQPVPEDPAGAWGVTADANDLKLSGLKILVVDDEEDTRGLIRQVLESREAEVHEASSAAEGMSVLQRVRPDLLVSDIGMPGCDGYQFIREVRSLDDGRGGRTPAVALTAYARTEDRTRAMLAGYQVHVAKPMDPAEFVATVASLAGRVR